MSFQEPDETEMMDEHEGSDPQDEAPVPTTYPQSLPHLQAPPNNQQQQQQQQQQPQQSPPQTQPQPQQHITAQVGGSNKSSFEMV